MPTCGITCGTGGWAGPLPGDPSNNSILSATPAFGGIDVTWTYPTTNPYAVSHVKLYRGITSSFGSALHIADVAGSFYYDKCDTVILYYYWIQIVSVNGTVGEVIGPASATSKPAIETVIEQLTGQIDDGFLATSLKTRLDEITLLRTDLQNEVMDRETGQTSLAQAIQDAQDGVAQAHTFLINETASRTTQDSAIIVNLNGVAATLGDSIAAVQSYATAQVSRIDGDISVLTEAVDQIIADGGGGTTAGIEDIKTARIGYSALNDGSLTPYEGNGSTIVYPVGTYPTATYPQYAADRTRIIDKVGVTNWNALPVGATTPLIWIAGLPLATAVKKVGVTGPNGEAATIEQAMLTQKGLNDQYKAMYTVKLDVNGMVGGFGLYNTGALVEAGFDVDRFWIGRTSADKRKPFIIDSGVVYIDDAAIKKLTFSKLRDEAGTFIVEGGKVKADYISGKGLTITDSAGNIILNAGSSTFLGNVTGSVNGTAASTLTSNVSTALTNAANAQSAANDAQADADAANAGLTTRLRSDAQNVLAGPGGLATGTLTWNSSGVRTGGYGVGFTQKGIVAYNSGGAATFTLDGTTGAATFAGALSAASGTFAGTLTAGAINAVNTINIAGNAVSANAVASGTAATISTTVTVPAGESYMVTGMGFQSGTGSGQGSTNRPAFSTLTLTSPNGSVPITVSPAIVDIDVYDQSLWGYLSQSIAAQDILGPGTHTISLTGIAGLSKTLLVLLSKR